ncbi:hypothetical protein IE81DRAFT_310758 [Ceraceosorus guamensis]|uniref:HIG1 domain-containing protein n=1 Tax=Ceraceosorus guamensis TaxID=1522189 RepID=A0A316W301_9BASI|nr:hypothetical protein IE81DRAFT_310758 [Ceraceosorus guamensis]PWN44246.1 hypothetical protein IE81DRAFT_310758 [Ceraceosorus guamensis]
MPVQSVYEAGPAVDPQAPTVRARRKHREQQIQEAYKLQRDAAIRGASTYGLVGLATIFTAHHYYPKFRSQTLALKSFLLSGFAIFGFVVGADTQLLTHESSQRIEENMIRTRARTELGRKGILASEAEIEKWRQETIDRLNREQGGAAAAAASHQASNSSHQNVNEDAR